MTKKSAYWDVGLTRQIAGKDNWELRTVMVLADSLEGAIEKLRKEPGWWQDGWTVHDIASRAAVTIIF